MKQIIIDVKTCKECLYFDDCVVVDAFCELYDGDIDKFSFDTSILETCPLTDKKD